MSSRQVNALRSVAIGAMLVSIPLALAIGYLLGRGNGEKGDAGQKRAASQSVGQPAATGTAISQTQRPSIPPVSVPDIRLATLTEADAHDLDMGCMGSFWRKKSVVLYVSGNTLIFRPDGKRVVGTITDKQFEQFNDDDAVAKAGGYRLRLLGRGPVGPGFDGHSRKATLTISAGSRATSFDGDWGVGC